MLDDLVRGTRDLELTWIAIEEHSRGAGRTLGQTRLRARTGASVMALARAQELVPNPTAGTVLCAGDRIAVIGSARQVAAATRALAGPDGEDGSAEPVAA